MPIAFFKLCNLCVCVCVCVAEKPAMFDINEKFIHDGDISFNEDFV